MSEPFVGREYPLRRHHLDSFSPLIEDAIREVPYARVSLEELHLTPHNFKAILPSRGELEEMRRSRSQFYSTILISSKQVSTHYLPRFPSYLPLRLPDPILYKFTTVLSELISELTGVSMRPSEISLIGENGKVVIPPQRELEMMKGGAPAFSALLVSATPINIP
jgi:hypothetical protein